jgi:hypothetical protein
MLSSRCVRTLVVTLQQRLNDQAVRKRNRRNQQRDGNQTAD